MTHRKLSGATLSLPTNCPRLTSVGQASSSVRPVERLSDQAATSAFTRTRLTVNSQASSSVRPVERLSETAAASASTRTRLTVNSQASSSVRPVERLSETAAASASTRTRLTVNSQVLLCLCPQVAQDARGGLRGEGQLAASPHLHHPVG